MDKQTYQLKLKEIRIKREELSNQERELVDQFLKSNAEFKVGDKVRVYYKWGSDTEQYRGDAFISGINDKYREGTVRYDFKKIKKDGTMSEQGAGIYSWTRLEKIN